MRQILLLEITFKTNRLLKLREKNSIRRLCFTDLPPSLAGMHCCASVDFYRSVSLILPVWFIPYTKPSESYLCIYISKWQRIHTAAISFLVWGDYSLPCNAAGGLIDWGKKKKKHQEEQNKDGGSAMHAEAMLGEQGALVKIQSFLLKPQRIKSEREGGGSGGGSCNTHPWTSVFL